MGKSQFGVSESHSTKERVEESQNRGRGTVKTVSRRWVSNIVGGPEMVETQVLRSRSQWGASVKWARVPLGCGHSLV